MPEGMLMSLCCDTPFRRVRLGWLSFQPKDGAVSFGLSDKTYVAPAFHASIALWNAYNRVRSYFEIVSDPSAADCVVNPHLTWHPPIRFHFKRCKQKKEDASFWGLADISIMITQQSEVKWIKATSGPISGLKTAGKLNTRFKAQETAIRIPSEQLSVQMEVDFVAHWGAARIIETPG
jgi:hypothetical protein